ncbi:hypothetical protein ATANTOWER_005401 [Ataeniobius toweri]|uniref:Uncharacterized protein n=1 Tax=Ataeniobius toweri TaxID=208326 RepID=A0ABU7CB87_9TELE|nr:hypothetical protein [Ataeniobius toweri]
MSPLYQGLKNESLIQGQYTIESILAIKACPFHIVFYGGILTLYMEKNFISSVRRGYWSLDQWCWVEAWTLASIIGRGLCAPGMAVHHQGKGTCRDSHPSLRACPPVLQAHSRLPFMLDFWHYV